MKNKFFLYSIISVPIICGLASFQHRVVMNVPFTFKFFIVPVFAALTFSWMGAKISQLIKLNEAKEWDSQLIKAERLSALGLFASGIAHDINNVLHGISAAFELKEKDNNNQKVDKIIKNNIKNGSELVKQLLGFAKGDNPEFENIDIKDLVNEVHELVNTFSKNKISINISLSNNSPKVFACRTQLFQVLLNLCINSIQALHNVKSPKLYISFRDDSSNVIIEVSDNGLGLPQNIRNNLFKPFQTEGKKEGTGIGLYICKQVIEKHNGKIVYKTSKEGGATFTITLPKIS